MLATTRLCVTCVFCLFSAKTCSEKLNLSFGASDRSFVLLISLRGIKTGHVWLKYSEITKYPTFLANAEKSDHLKTQVRKKII